MLDAPARKIVGFGKRRVSVWTDARHSSLIGDVLERGSREKDLSTSYALAVIGLVTPVAGLHHFYLGQPVMGLAYLFTFGFCGIGTIVDLIRLPGLVDDVNIRSRLLSAGPTPFAALPPPSTGPAPARAPKPMSAEQKILHAAKAHTGAITVALASIETGIPLDDCRRLLDKMAKSGYCERDVSDQAVDLYVFPGLRSNKPFEID